MSGPPSSAASGQAAATHDGHATQDWLLAFVHIEKTAGTTTLYLLRRNFLGRYVDVRPLRAGSNGHFTAHDLEVYLRINPLLRCIGGHSIRPLDDLGQAHEDVRYVTLLRDPVHRYLSQFRYWNRSLKKNWSFESFLDHEESHDFQTKKIAPGKPVEVAKSTLRQRFMVVGVAEHFDEFLCELAFRLRPRVFDTAYRRRNVDTSAARNEDELLERHGDRIRSNNARDIELYRYAVEELLPERRAQLESDLARGGGELQQPFDKSTAWDTRLLLDAALRKGYYEPVTGAIRRLHGMPMKGSY